MNNSLSQRLFCLLSLATITVVGSSFSAQAETVSNGSTNTSAKLAVAPVPGTTATSAAALTTEPTMTRELAPAAKTPTRKVAQDIGVGTATRGGSSYIGIAGNIGLSGGESSLGIGNIAVISKIGLTRNISLRPGAVFGDNPTVLIPITYDFRLGPRGVLGVPTPVSVAPYLGAGVAINTSSSRSDTGALVTAGVDVPLTRNFTANAGVNVGFINNTSVGLQVGIGYNFNGIGF